MSPTRDTHFNLSLSFLFHIKPNIILLASVKVLTIWILPIIVKFLHFQSCNFILIASIISLKFSLSQTTVISKIHPEYFHSSINVNVRNTLVLCWSHNWVPQEQHFCFVKIYDTTSFPGSTPLSRWRLREDPGTHRYTPREILHKSWSILSRDTQ